MTLCMYYNFQEPLAILKHIGAVNRDLLEPATCDMKK